MTIPLLLLGSGVPADPRQRLLRGGRVRPRHRRAARTPSGPPPRATGAPARSSSPCKELSFQLSGTQLGITITSLVVGMLAEPALAELLHGPFTAIGLPRGRRLRRRRGRRHAAGLRRADGDRRARAQELGGLQAAAGRRASSPARSTPSPGSSGPVIAGLNTVANRLVRALGVEPAEELASARTPGELVSLARHSAQAGALEQDTADLFVRTLSLGELTAQHVMTPRVKVSALQSHGHRRGRRQPDPRHRPVPLPRLPRAASTRSSAWSTSRTPSRCPAERPAAHPGRPDRRARRCWSPRRCPCSRCWTGCAASSPSPSSSTSTAARPVSSPWRTSSRSSSARSATSTTRARRPPELAAAPPEDGRPAWDADGSCRVDTLQRIGLDVPEGPYETRRRPGRRPARPHPRRRRPGRAARLAAVGPPGRPLPRRAGPPASRHRPPTRPTRGGGRPMSVAPTPLRRCCSCSPTASSSAPSSPSSPCAAARSNRCGTVRGPGRCCTAWSSCRR